MILSRYSKPGVLRKMSMAALLGIALSGSSQSARADSRSELEELLFSKDSKSTHTDAVLIKQNGKIIYENYARGYTAQTPHLSWSMAKTITGILVGQRAAEGVFNLDEKLSSILPSIASKDATIKDTLQMSSGLHFTEQYSGIPVTADVTKLLYLNGVETGMGEYVASLPARKNETPGKHFYYSTGDTNLLSLILKKTFSTQEEYDAYPNKKIFDRLDIKNVTFEQDSKKTFIGSSYIYMTLRDFGKIGELLQNKGKWGESQIIPESYFELMNTVAPGVRSNPLPGTSFTRAYSSQVTTNQPIAERKLPSEYSDLPSDALLMIGHQGQLIVSSPSQKLVIVRLAMDKGDQFDRRAFFDKAIALIRSNGSKITTARDEHPEWYPAGYTSPASAKENTKTGISDYFKLPQLIRALAAKEYCSCIYVVGRSKKECKEDLETTLPTLPRLHAKDGKVRAVLLTGIFGKDSVAEYRGKALGCTLTTSE